MRLCVELLVSQELIQAETTVSRKASTPQSCCFVLQCSDRKCIQSGYEGKQVTMNMAETPEDI